MGLMTEWVEMEVNPANVVHYENLGYEIIRIKNKWRKTTIARGTKILVSVKHLTNGSHALIDCRCDGICNGKILENIQWCNYLSTVDENGNTYCFDCSHKLFAGEKSRKTALKNGKSIYQWCVENEDFEIVNRWDDELNGYSFHDVAYSTNKFKPYLKCPLGVHDSEKQNIAGYTRGQKGSIYCTMCDSLGFNYPEVENIWSNKNKKSIYDYSWGSKKEVWWMCENNKHEDYERPIYDSYDKNFRCPSCVQERTESFLQEKVRLYLEMVKENYIEDVIINHESNCSLFCINPITKSRLRYDNEVIGSKFKLIVEVNGMQHYEICKFHFTEAGRKNISLDEEFKYQQYKDEYKKQFALNDGYYYLAIPYWEDDKNETWKIQLDKFFSNIYNY